MRREKCRTESYSNDRQWGIADGRIQKLLSEKTRLIAIAHSKNIPVLLDGTQSIPHIKADVQDLDADFYCFSGHKVYAPAGVGIFYGKEKWLKKLPNYQVRRGTIKTVSFNKSEYAEPTLRFEAGTPNIEGALVWQRHLITSTHLVLKTLLFMNRNYWSMLQKNFLQFTICGLLAQQKKKQV
jgi:hypothetical protein